jgi:hypothetical protein
MFWPMDRVFYRIMLITIMIIGAVAIIVPSEYNWSFDHGIFVELGKAFIIAGILGFTIEPWMRKSLARDVFSAAFGYHVPDDFKTEIARIAGFSIICTKHIMDVKIRASRDDTLQVFVTIERHFENVGSSPALHRAMIWIDEWGFSEKSQILQCSIYNSTATRSKQFDRKKIEYHNNRSLKAQSPQMVMFPGEAVSTIVEYAATRRRNDHIYEVFLTPTRRPEIRITEVPEDIQAVADFGGEGKLKPTHIPNRYELDGVYFPPAPMRVRWWPKAEQWPV